MSAETLTSHSGAEQEPVVVSGELRCALTGRVLTPEEAYWAPPLVTARQLITALLMTLFRSPGAVGQVLLGDLPNVPYAPEARAQLGSRRSVEQLKLLAVLLVVAALFVVPLVMLAS